MLDVIRPDEELSAAEYSRRARQAISDIRDRNRLPVVVGGTGFYLRALLDGLSPAPDRDEDLRRRLRELESRRPGVLYRFLRRFDPEASRRIHPNDQQKLIRAVEITILAGQPATQTQSRPRDSIKGFGVLKLGLAPHRDRLYSHLNERCAGMFEFGLLPETEALLSAGFSPDLKSLQSLGYKQAVKVLRGVLPIHDGLQEYQDKTRQYAKRQITWFRSERGVEWLPGFGFEEQIQREALERTQDFLKSSGC